MPFATLAAQSRHPTRQFGSATAIVLAMIAASLMTACLVASWQLGAVGPLQAAEAVAAKLETPTVREFEFQQVLMGVPFRLVIHSDSEAKSTRAAAAAFARVKQLNLIFSDYDDDSEAMTLCRTSGPGRPVPVSDEMLRVLKQALELAKRSEGAFDPTVGPVVKLWRKARRRKQLPDPRELAEARARVGWRFVRLDEKQKTVELLREGMLLDFGGIVKGYAADEALAVLVKAGCSHALVAASGDIVAGDAPPGKPGWKIGIAPLEKPEGAPSRHVWLKRSAVSTSGDAFQALEIMGTRYSHIVDPRTGLGVRGRMSVTVLARRCIQADSLASTLCVLDPSKGFRLIQETPGTSALRVELRDGKPVVKHTQDFPTAHDPPRK